MRLEAQIARFWLLRRRVSQRLRAHSQTRKHWVENEHEAAKKVRTEVLNALGMLDTIVTFQDGADLVRTYTFRPYAFLDSFRLEHTGSPQTNGTGHPTPD